jgi:hypothetical protein
MTYGAFATPWGLALEAACGQYLALDCGQVITHCEKMPSVAVILLQIIQTHIAEMLKLIRPCHHSACNVFAIFGL